MGTNFVRRSSQSFNPQFENPSVLSYCGFTSHAKSASTWKNFGRMFYGCPNYKNNGCDYFEWCETPMCIYGRSVVTKFRKMHVKIETEGGVVLRREMMWIIVVGVLAVVLLAVVTKLVIS